MRNLESVIKSLVDERQALTTRAHSQVIKSLNKEERFQLIRRYNTIENQLEDITKEYAMTCRNFARVVAKHYKKRYAFNVLRELDDEGYTFRFIAGYFPLDNKYAGHTHLLTTEQYEEMLESVSDGSVFVIARERDVDQILFRPEVEYDYINLIQLFTAPQEDIKFINPRAKEIIKKLLQKELATIETEEYGL